MKNGQIIMPPMSLNIVPVGKLNIPGLGWFNPLDDITTKELAFIMQMLTIGVIGSMPGDMYNFKKYAEEHNISRHFTIKENPDAIILDSQPSPEAAKDA